MSAVDQSMGAVQDTPATLQAAVSISVIIPALNEEKMNGRCLESLAGLDFPGGGFEVLLVDNGSTDRTLEIAKSFQSRLNLRVMEKAGVRISALRNLGAREAHGAM